MDVAKKKRLRGRFKTVVPRPNEVPRDPIRKAMGVHNRKEVFAVNKVIKQVLILHGVSLMRAWAFQDPGKMISVVADVLIKIQPTYPFWNAGIARAAIMKYLVDKGRTIRRKANGYIARMPLAYERARPRPCSYAPNPMAEDSAQQRPSIQQTTTRQAAATTATSDRRVEKTAPINSNNDTNARKEAHRPDAKNVNSEIATRSANPRTHHTDVDAPVTVINHTANSNHRSSPREKVEYVSSVQKALEEQSQKEVLDRALMPPPSLSCQPSMARQRKLSPTAYLRIEFVKSRDDMELVASFGLSLYKKCPIRRFFLSVEKNLERTLDENETFFIYVPIDDPTRPWSLVKDIHALAMLFADEGKGRGAYMMTIDFVCQSHC